MDSDQKRVLLAVILSAVVLFGWQIFFAPKRPTTTEENTGQEIARKSRFNETLESDVVKYQSDGKKNELASNISNIPKLFSMTNGDESLVLDESLTVKDITSKNAAIPFTEIVGEKNFPFQFQLLTDGGGVRPFKFHIVKEGEDKLVGNDNKNGVSFIAKIIPSGKVVIKLTSRIPQRYSFSIKSTSKEENQKIRQFILYNRNDVERVDLEDDEKLEGVAHWFGIDFNYHLFVFNFLEKTKFVASTNHKGRLTLSTLEPVHELKGDLIFTKKNFDILASHGNNLESSVDLDIWFLAIPILRGLQFFYKYTANYGLCIILLTLIIRLITFPLQYKSFKSMKKMQDLQPDLAKIRKRYKKDPQRMQRETMALFKRSGTNPMGGCLPMLLQLPIFFAFYSVLREAVELVGAPFLWWIRDLSVKDPYYVLPVFVCLVFFLNQKITPMATADPTQKKIMMIMPIVFGFIMKDLPSGLSLYIFISTLFGIGQQMLVYRFTR